MGLHKPFDRDFFLVNGNVLTTGGSKNLAKGQFAVVDVKSATANGAKVVSSYASANRDSIFEFRVGVSKKSNTRTAQNSKPDSSLPFKLSDIREVYVSAPDVTKQTFDDILVGYDGINADTAITFVDGDSTVLDVILKGKAIGLIGEQNEYKFKIHFGKVNGQTNQEVVEAAVKRLQEELLPTGIPLTDFVDIKVIDSSRAALPAASYTVSTISVVDAGDSNAHALVAAKYNAYEVVLTARVGQTSTYSILHPVAVTLDAYETQAWVAGESLYTSTDTYNIQLADGEAGASRLAELQAAYPDLTITKTATVGGCQGVYTTTVVTGVVGAECSNIFVQDFTSEAPEDFDFVSWTKAPVVPNAGALMGIRITGKPIVVDPEEQFKDEVPFMETSARIVVAGGYTEEFNLSTPQYNDDFTITVLGWAKDRDHLGANLRAKEEESRVYFSGDIRIRGNNFAKALLGQESVLENRKQYVDYAIVVGDNGYAQGFGSSMNTSITYHFHIELGKTAAFQTEFNKLAVKAGFTAVTV